MFTIVAIICAFQIGKAVDWYNVVDRGSYDRAPEDERLWLLALHIRQDVKLIAFWLVASFVALGVIADLVALGVIALWWRH
jgi:hypothetical protein